MRASLQSAGITVRDDARVAPTPPQKTGRVLPLLAVHESAPLGILLRKINKDSDNDYAERVLEAAGAEVYGGAPTGDKGVRLLREVIGELGPAAGQLRAEERLGAGAREPHHGRRDVGAAADAVPGSARRARRSCSRSRWAASTAPRATASRGRSPRSACARRPARCTASRASRAWWATGPTCSRSRSWWRGSGGGAWPRCAAPRWAA